MDLNRALMKDADWLVHFLWETFPLLKHTLTLTHWTQFRQLLGRSVTLITASYWVKHEHHAMFKYW